ncbi:MAG TPA: MarR family transcriptional regulator [Candidatus Saccharimonadales bacterium]|nr:MarR family transcriptional regulator [Candidatus Saccharimonadales bacterium]
MRLGSIKNLKAVRASLGVTTYEAGLLQARAYRALKNYFSASLEPYGLTMTQWALLGHLFSHPQGLRLSEISVVLSVEAPLATNLVTSLERKQLVRRHPDSSDNRAKLVVISPDGRKLVPQIEKELRAAMKLFLEGVSIEELSAYLQVLQTMATKA